MDFKYPYKNNLQNELLEQPDWFKNKLLHQVLDEHREQGCTPNDCWCSYHDNPHDNYFYSHILNPADRYFFWIQHWKEQHFEIHKGCKELGQTTYTDEYVRGFFDAISPEYSTINSSKEEKEN